MAYEIHARGQFGHRSLVAGDGVCQQTRWNNENNKEDRCAGQNRVENVTELPRHRRYMVRRGTETMVSTRRLTLLLIHPACGLQPRRLDWPRCWALAFEKPMFGQPLTAARSAFARSPSMSNARRWD